MLSQVKRPRVHYFFLENLLLNGNFIFYWLSGKLKLNLIKMEIKNAALFTFLKLGMLGKLGMYFFLKSNGFI